VDRTHGEFREARGAADRAAQSARIRDAHVPVAHEVRRDAAARLGHVEAAREATGTHAAAHADHGPLAAHPAEYTDCAGSPGSGEHRMFRDNPTYAASNRANRATNRRSARRCRRSFTAPAEKLLSNAKAETRHATHRGPPKRVTLVKVATVVTLVVTHGYLPPFI
jgi:hypothetical protein